MTILDAMAKIFSDYLVYYAVISKLVRIKRLQHQSRITSHINQIGPAMASRTGDTADAFSIKIHQTGDHFEGRSLLETAL